MKRIIMLLVLIISFTACETKSKKRRRVVKPETTQKQTTAPKPTTTKTPVVSQPNKAIGQTGKDTYTFIINEAIKIDKTQRFSYQDDSKKESQNVTKFWLEGNTIKVLVQDGHTMYTYTELNILGRDWDKNYQEKLRLLSTKVSIAPNDWSSDQEEMLITFYISETDEVIKVVLGNRNYYKSKPKKKSKKISKVTPKKKGATSSSKPKKKVIKKKKKTPRKSSTELQSRSFYTVKKGDTWSAIARSFNTSVQHLQSINTHIVNERGNLIIKENDKIYLK